MGTHLALRLVKLLSQKEIQMSGSRGLLLGITFKENCPDIRNSKVVDFYQELVEYGINLEVYDPWADQEEVMEEYKIDLINEPSGNYECIILAVSHQEFNSIDYKGLLSQKGVIFDIKGFLDKSFGAYRI